MGTNNVYKNINLGRQTFNYKSVSLEILTNPTITVILSTIYEIIGKPPFSLIQHKFPRADSNSCPSEKTAALKSQIISSAISDISELFDVVLSLHLFFFDDTSRNSPDVDLKIEDIFLDSGKRACQKQ